jgi:hypothetical protein
VSVVEGGETLEFVTDLSGPAVDQRLADGTGRGIGDLPAGFGDDDGLPRLAMPVDRIRFGWTLGGGPS